MQVTRMSHAGNVRRLGFVVALSTLAACGFARAEDYPSRSVSFLVPYAPGGGTDVYSRMLAEELRTQLKQSLRDRKQGGRGNCDRGCGVVEIGSGRLHDHDGVEHDAGDESVALQQADIRSGRSRAGRSCGEPPILCWSLTRRYRQRRSLN